MNDNSRSTRRTGLIAAFIIFMAVWAADTFWLKWTTFASEVIPMPLALGGAILLWSIAGIFLTIADFSRRDHQPIAAAAWLGSLGLVCASLSLASLAVWLLIRYFRRWQLCRDCVPENAIGLNNYNGGKTR